LAARSGKAADQQPGEIGCEHNAIVSPDFKNGFASNPIHAKLASNNAAWAQLRAHPLRSRRESDCDRA
jgi:hypothetical protein